MATPYTCNIQTTLLYLNAYLCTHLYCGVLGVLSVFKKLHLSLAFSNLSTTYLKIYIVQLVCFASHIFFESYLNTLVYYMFVQVIEIL